jgi:hypothetical protein
MPSSNLPSRSNEMAQRNEEHSSLSDAGISADQSLDAQGIGVSDGFGELHAAPKEFPPSELQKIRQLIFRTFLIVGLVIVAWCAFRYMPTLAVSALMALMSYAGALSVVRRARKARWLSRWDVVRFVRGIRKSFAASPVALTLYAACFGMATIAVSVLIWTQSPLVFALFGVAVGVVLCVATFVDWYARLRYVLSISVIRQSAKLVVAFLAATTVFLSTVIAKQLTHSIALADPASMPEFVRLISAFVFPFALSAVLSATLSFVMITQYVVLLAGMFITMPIKYTVVCFSPPMRTRLVGIGYRVLHGRRPSNNRPWWDQLVDGVQHFLRPVGTGAIAGFVIFLGVVVVDLAGHIPGKYLQAVLVKTEYRSPHLCENILASAHVAYLQDGYVSVATPQSEGYKFSVEKCHK